MPSEQLSRTQRLEHCLLAAIDAGAALQSLVQALQAHGVILDDAPGLRIPDSTPRRWYEKPGSRSCCSSMRPTTSTATR